MYWDKFSDKKRGQLFQRTIKVFRDVNKQTKKEHSALRCEQTNKKKNTALRKRYNRQVTWLRRERMKVGKEWEAS